MKTNYNFVLSILGGQKDESKQAQIDPHPQELQSNPQNQEGFPGFPQSNGYDLNQPQDYHANPHNFNGEVYEYEFNENSGGMGGSVVTGGCFEDYEGQLAGIYQQGNGSSSFPQDQWLQPLSNKSMNAKEEKKKKTKSNGAKKGKKGKDETSDVFQQYLKNPYGNDQNFNEEEKSAVYFDNLPREKSPEPPKEVIIKPDPDYNPFLTRDQTMIRGQGEGNQNSFYRIGDMKEWNRKDFKWSNEIEGFNSELFGHTDFRENQRSIINCALAGHDVFVCMPTGGGKSLCFQIPGIYLKGLSVVIMPIISLIYDQVVFLKRLGLPAEMITGSTTPKQQREIYQDCLNNPDYGVKLLYICPERIAQSANFYNFLDRLYAQQNLARFVIDEAHCVSNWGHDFRPDYLCLKSLKERFPQIPMMALTATATENARVDIIKTLGMKRPYYFQSSFNRPNLHYEVKIRPPKMTGFVSEVVKFIKGNYDRKPGIIYCSTTATCDQVVELLIKEKIKAAPYHAKLTEYDRNQNQDMWMSENILIMVATLAFGMGINKSNVRFVIHYNIPKSIEAYYQESGRAGRDSLKSHVVLYYNETDLKTIQNLMDSNEGIKGDVSVENYRNVFFMKKYCDEKFLCRRTMILGYLGESFNRDKCNGFCDNCQSDDEFQVIDYTEEAKKFLRLLEMCGRKDLSRKDIIKGLKSRPGDLTMEAPVGKKFWKGGKKDTSNVNFRGLFSYLDIKTVTAIVDEMIVLGLLRGKVQHFNNKFGHHSCRYMEPGFKAMKQMEAGRMVVHVIKAVSSNGSKAKGSTKTKEERQKESEEKKKKKKEERARARKAKKEEMKKAKREEKKKAKKEGAKKEEIKTEIIKKEEVPKKENKKKEGKKKKEKKKEETPAKLEPKKETTPVESESESDDESSKSEDSEEIESKKKLENFGPLGENKFNDLLEKLIQVRSGYAWSIKDKDPALFNNQDLIFSTDGLKDFARKLPETHEEMMKIIKGVPMKLLEGDGPMYLQATVEFKKKEGIFGTWKHPLLTETKGKEPEKRPYPSLENFAFARKTQGTQKIKTDAETTEKKITMGDGMNEEFGLETFYEFMNDEDKK